MLREATLSQYWGSLYVGLDSFGSKPTLLQRGSPYPSLMMIMWHINKLQEI
jgi:hypothetical protein